MKILAFAASNNKQSINKQLARYAAHLVTNANVETLDIFDYEMPIFSDAREKALGVPQQALSFYQKIGDADAIVLSFAEHNGSYTAAYKNLFDWTSRISQKVFQNKPMLLLSTSPGQSGAASVLAAASNSAPYFAANVIASICVPSFFENFDIETQTMTNPEFEQKLQQAAKLLEASLVCHV